MTKATYAEDEHGYGILCFGGQTHKTSRPVVKISYTKYIDATNPCWAFYVYDASGVRWLYRVETEEEIKALVNDYARCHKERSKSWSNPEILNIVRSRLQISSNN